MKICDAWAAFHPNLQTTLPETNSLPPENGWLEYSRCFLLVWPTVLRGEILVLGSVPPKIPPPKIGGASGFLHPFRCFKDRFSIAPCKGNIRSFPNDLLVGIHPEFDVVKMGSSRF